MVIYRIAKTDNLFGGPLSSGNPSSWEYSESLMDLETVTPKEPHWLYGFTEIQKDLFLDRRTLNKLMGEGFTLYQLEVPENEVEIHEDQVCFNPQSINQGE